MNLSLVLISLLVGQDLPAMELKPGMTSVSPLISGLVHFEDIDGNETIESIASKSLADFEKTDRSVWRSKHTEAIHWFRLDFTNNSDSVEWVTEFDHLYVEDLVVQFRTAESIIVERQFGYAYPFDSRGLNYRNYVVNADLPRNERLQLIIRLKSRTLAQLVVTMAPPVSWVDSIHTETLLFGIYYGGILLLIIYNIGVGIALRSKLHFLYIFHALSFSFDMTNFNGFSYQYFWPDLPYLDYYMKNASICLSSIAIIAFCREIIELRSHIKIFDNILLGSIGVSIILLICVPFGVQFKETLFILPLATVGICLVASIARAFQRSKAALLYLIAWIPFAIGGIIHLFAGLGLFDVSGFGRYIIQIASGLEVLIMALVLTWRVGNIESLRQRAESEAETGRKMLGILSHELRTPLNGSLGMNRLLLGTHLTSSQREMASLAYRSGQLTLGLINNILDFAGKGENGIIVHPVACDLNEIFRDVVAIARSHSTERNIEFGTTYDENIHSTVILDADKLRQVLLNFATNAVKYTKSGKITLICTLVSETDSRQVVHFSVSDTGIGISEADIAKIFEPYFRGQNHNEVGTGLGLTISKVILDAMKAKFTVTSELGKGSTFAFDLEMAKFQPAADQERIFSADFSTREWQLSGCRILVVDDEPLNRRVMREFLNMAGVEVAEVSSGNDTIEILKTHEFDLILLDCWMPELSGEEVARKIRATSKHARMPIIAVTALHAGEAALSAYFTSGIDDILPKPINPDTLIQKIEEWYLASKGQPVGDRHIAMRVGVQEDWQAFVVESVEAIQYREQEILQAYETEDWENAIAELHALNGIVGILGFNRIDDEIRAEIASLRTGVANPQFIVSLERDIHLIQFCLGAFAQSVDSRSRVPLTS